MRRNLVFVVPLVMVAAGCGGSGDTAQTAPASGTTGAHAVAKKDQDRPRKTDSPRPPGNYRDVSSESAVKRTKRTAEPKGSSATNGGQMSTSQKMAAEKGSGGGKQHSAAQKIAAEKGSADGKQQSAAEKMTGR
jgi:hypothetical protein